MQLIEDPQFYEPRDCFLAPIPEIFAAANLLSRAVEAIFEKNITLAEDLIKQADIPALEAHNRKIATYRSKEIHRVRLVPGAPPTIKDRTQRMPPYKVELSIYERDGWHCRFCQSPVTSKEARKNYMHYFLWRPDGEKSIRKSIVGSAFWSRLWITYCRIVVAATILWKI
jgi:hypothetical protein